MGKLQIFLLVLLAIGITTLMLVTWGSVGSALMGYGLITVMSALLYRKFMDSREESDYQMEE